MDYIEPLKLLTHVTGNSIESTHPLNQAWGHCGETRACKTTQWPLLYPCLSEWDVLMWSVRLCNSFGEASPHKVTWLHRLIYMSSSTIHAQSNKRLECGNWYWRQIFIFSFSAFNFCLEFVHTNTMMLYPIWLLWLKAIKLRHTSKCLRFVTKI